MNTMIHRVAVVASVAALASCPFASAQKPAAGTASQSDAKTSVTGDTAVKKKTQVFVLPLDGMVGVGLRHEEMEEVEKIADAIGPGQVIILRVNSNGGLVIEGDKISESLLRIKQKHRLVAWIEKAISGGAFTALHADEMYFMPEAALGSITMLSGQTEVAAVREDWKARVAEACAMGGRDPKIGPAMVHSAVELSYDKDPKTGRVTFYNDYKHAFKLSSNTENLDFSAATAEHSGFSEGTAATEAQLFKELGVDDQEKFAVNDAGKKIASKWQKLIKGAHDEVPLLIQKRDIEGTSGGGIGFLQARIRNTQKIIDWFKKAKPAMIYELNVSERTIEALELEIKEMREQIKEMQSRQGN
ncbi:MAG: hypothetical protein EXS03_01290 [Phycisphaerales bacterium]|nr:hypothetical protein [Phycisphaerales bacterium]